MRRSRRRMLRAGGKKEPQGVVYQGVEDDMDDSTNSFKVPWAIGAGNSGVRAGIGSPPLCPPGFEVAGWSAPGRGRGERGG